MRKRESGAGSVPPRSLFRAALLALLLLVLLFLAWVCACVPPIEGPAEPAALTPEPAGPETLFLPVWTEPSGGTEPVRPGTAGDPGPGETPAPEETPAPADRASGSVPAETDSPGIRNGVLKKGMLGTLTYNRKSVGVWPDIREDTLLKGPGWMPESALPGEGMAVILGHRNRNHLLLIKKIKEGDTLTFSYADGRTLVYRVRSVQIFETTSEWRLPAESGDVLVVATCYPFQYTGSAPGKFQVIADRAG